MMHSTHFYYPLHRRQKYMFIRKGPSGLSTHQVRALPYPVLTSHTQAGEVVGIIF